MNKKQQSETEFSLDVEELKYTIATSLRELERMIGKEAVKDYIKDFPLLF